MECTTYPGREERWLAQYRQQSAPKKVELDTILGKVIYIVAYRHEAVLDSALACRHVRIRGHGVDVSCRRLVGLSKDENHLKIIGVAACLYTLGSG